MIGNYCVLLAVWLAPIGAILGMVHLRKWHIGRRKSRVPVAEKLLRGPGESLRQMLEELEDQISEKLTMALFLPFFCTSAVMLQPHATLLGPATIVGLTVGGPIFVYLCYGLWHLLDRRRDYRLGLLGERAVGGELNQLMLTGCRVYHDVPNDPYGNVDHVLVAPTGVYALETKTRRKQETAGRGAHKVAFDGRCLQFAGGTPESRYLGQARHQASRLSDWLSKAIGEAVEVRPVLALPGWWVDRRGRGEVIVISGKEVDSLARGRAVLDAPKITRIAHQLEQRCRDVEF